MTTEQQPNEKLPHGLFRMGKHYYGICDDCGKLVCVTGWFGGLHLCLTAAERAEQQRRRAGETPDTP